MNRRDREFEALDRLLKNMPRHRASPGFAKRVLAHTDTGQGSLSGRSRFGYGLAAVAVLGLLAMFLFFPDADRQVDETETVNRAALLRLMHQTRTLKAELADLRGTMPRSTRAVALGRSGDVAYYVNIDGLVTLRDHRD